MKRRWLTHRLQEWNSLHVPDTLQAELSGLILTPSAAFGGHINDYLERPAFCLLPMFQVFNTSLLLRPRSFSILVSPAATCYLHPSPLAAIT